jgi:hypothetical protein
MHATLCQPKKKIRHHPTCLNALLNPANSSIVSRIDAADLDRFRRFGRGTSSKPLERDVLRLLLPTMTAISWEDGGGRDARDEERDVSDEEIDVLEMVGIRGDVGSLLYANWGIKLLQPKGKLHMGRKMDT